MGLRAQDATLRFAEELIRRNKIDSAVNILTTAIKNSADSKEKGLAYLQLGSVYKQQENYKKSLAAYQNAIHIFKTQGSAPEIFRTYSGLAELYRYQRLYKSAEEYLRHAERIRKREDIPDNYLIKYYSRKAAVFAEYQENLDSALIYSEKSMIIAKNTGDVEGLLVSLMEISGIQEKRKNYTQAIAISKEIIGVAGSLDNIQLKCDALVNLCRNLNLSKQYKESIKTSLEAFEFAGRHKKDYNQLLIADNLQEAYTQINDYKNAHKYLRIRLDLTEDFYDKLYDQKVLEYEKKFQLSEKENEISDNKKQLLLKEQELKRQELIRYSTMLAMLAVAVFAGILMYNTRTIRQKNKALQLASEENEFLVSETHHRINNNLQLISILIENELKRNPYSDDFSNRRIIAKINSLGILHRHLYKKGKSKNICLNLFLADIWKNTDQLFEANGIKIRFEVADIMMPENKAMYLGLLVTELCINSLKHAFGKQEDKYIALKIKAENTFIFFHYEDNGTFTGKIPKLNLVDKLCRQLRVDYKTDIADGFKFNFEMKM